MHETEDQQEARWGQYQATFLIACGERGADVPTGSAMRKYFDEAIDLPLAVGHYLVETMRSKRR